MNTNVQHLLKNHLKKLNKQKVITMTVFVICSFFGLLQPFFLGSAIDQLSAGNPYYVQYLWLCGILLVVSFVLNYIQNYMWFKMIYKSYELSRNLFLEQVEYQSYAFFKKYQQGDITNRILYDSTQLSEYILITVPIALLNTFRIVVIFALLLYLNVYLAVVVMIAMVGYFFYYKFLNNKLRIYQKRERDSFSQVMNDLDDILKGMDTIQMNQSQNFFLNRFKNTNRHYYSFVMKLQKYNTTCPISCTIF